jgi:protein-disulfide isomerase
MSKNKNKFQEETKPEPEVVDVVSTGEISINIQPYLVPLSIIVGAIVISLSIFLSVKGQLFSQTPSVAGITNPTTAPAAADEQNPAAKTNLTGAPFIGDKSKAKVAIVEFSDVECPFCKRHHEQVYPDIVKNLVDTGKVVYAYRTYIAVPSHNPAATLEANAAYCLLEQTGSNGKFFDYMKGLYTNTQANGSGLAGTKTFDLANELGGNAANVKSCAESNKFKDFIANDQTLAEQAGIQGTPGFIVGKLSEDGTVDGKLIAGAYPYSEFERIVAEMSK